MAEETKLTITPLDEHSKVPCEIQPCTRIGTLATTRITYDHGQGPENDMYYCDRHSAQEQSNVATDNRNRAAGYILF